MAVILRHFTVTCGGGMGRPSGATSREGSNTMFCPACSASGVMASVRATSLKVTSVSFSSAAGALLAVASGPTSGA